MDSGEFGLDLGLSSVMVCMYLDLSTVCVFCRGLHDIDVKLGFNTQWKVPFIIDFFMMKRSHLLLTIAFYML